VRFYRDTSGTDRQQEQFLLAQREARASEARSGSRRGDRNDKAREQAEKISN
jgi:hypothetical protein